MTSQENTKKSQEEQASATPLKNAPSRSKRLGNIILGAMKLEESGLDNLHFGLATEKWQIEQAFTLLKESYLEEGYITDNHSAIHTTKYHVLPTTSIIVAYQQKTVVATLSIVKDSVFGLPANEVSNASVSLFHQRAEISGFVISKDYRNHEGQILLPLFKYLSHYCKHYIAVDHLVISVHPKSFSFYKYLLGFSELSMIRTSNYEFANGKPVKCGLLDLNRFPEVIRKHYSDNQGIKDLYGFFKLKQPDNFHYPERNYDNAFDLAWTPELLHYFFVEQSELLKNMSAHEREVLWNLYDTQSFHEIFSDTMPLVSRRRLPSRNHVRVDVNFASRITLESGNGTSQEGLIRDASLDGFANYCPDATIQLGATYRFQIRLERFSVCEITAVAVHRLDNGYYGFKIVSNAEKWVACLANVVGPMEKSADWSFAA